MQEENSGNGRSRCFLRAEYAIMGTSFMPRYFHTGGDPKFLWEVAKQ